MKDDSDPRMPTIEDAAAPLREAWYYAGLKRLLNGDKAGAAEAFRKAVAAGEKTTNGNDFAEAELKDLGR